MSTTVPQNIKGQNIMGRHKPTRQSLRHSRHIVTSKHFQGESRGFARTLVINSRLLCRPHPLKLAEHPPRVAGEVCVDLENRHRHQYFGTRRVDLFVRKLNADPTEPVLEWPHLDSLGPPGPLLAQLQADAVEAQSQLLLVPEGKHFSVPINTGCRLMSCLRHVIDITRCDHCGNVTSRKNKGISPEKLAPS